MNTEKIAVLLIEDNPGDIRLIQEMLTQTPIKLKPADTLSKGLEIVREDGIDLILLDLGLPESQGLETLNKTQKEVLDIPIVVLTGLEDEEVGVKAIQNGAQDYLVKGQVDSSLLARCIRYARIASLIIESYGFRCLISKIESKGILMYSLPGGQLSPPGRQK